MHPPAMIDEAVLPLVVEAARNLPDPVRGVARHLGDCVGRVALRQEPEELPVTALHPLTGAAVALLEFVYTQVRRKLDASCHASILHQHVILWYYYAPSSQVITAEQWSDPWKLLVPVAVGLILGIAGLIAFKRRDLTV